MEKGSGFVKLSDSTGQLQIDTSSPLHAAFNSQVALGEYMLVLGQIVPGQPLTLRAAKVGSSSMRSCFAAVWCRTTAHSCQ